MLAAFAPDSAGATPNIRGVISLYGPVDLTDGWRRPPSPDPLKVRAVEEALIGGTPDELPARYREASPLTLPWVIWSAVAYRKDLAGP